jgi:hypothetical protein
MVNMNIFRRFIPRASRQYTHYQETGPQRFLRFFFVGILFAIVLWGFWMNSERQMERVILRAATQIDSTGLLARDQEEQVLRYAQRFFEAYGLKLQVEIKNEPLSDKKARAAGSVYLGLNPAAGEALFYAPPLVAAALGEDLIRQVREEHFQPYFAAGNWPEGLAAALNLLSTNLDKVLRP